MVNVGEVRLRGGLLLSTCRDADAVNATVVSLDVRAGLREPSIMVCPYGSYGRILLGADGPPIVDRVATRVFNLFG